MGEAKQVEIEARGYGAWVEWEEDRPPADLWPSEDEMRADADNQP